MKSKNNTFQYLGFTKFITLSFGLAVAGLSTHSSQAGTIYWDTAAGANWSDVTKWSTASGATTPDPGAVPAIGDDVIFNITGVNGAEIITLNGNQAANTLTFNNTGTTTIRSTVANQTLTLASGITVNTGAGAVTIGSGTAAQRTNVILGTAGANQAWTLDGTTSMTATNGVAGSASTGNTQTLTINGSSTGTMAFSGNLTAITDGANGGKLALLVNGSAIGSATTAGLGVQLNTANSYTGGTTITQGRVNAMNVLSFGAANSLVTVQGSTDGGAGGQAWLGVNNGTWLYDFNISGFGNNELGANGQKYAMRINTGATIGASTNTFTVANAAAIGTSGVGSFTIASKITGTGALTIREGGTLNQVTTATFTNANNDYSGTTTLTRAILQLNASTAAQNSIIDTGAGTSNVLKFGNGITAATIGGLAGTGSGALSLLNNVSGAVALTVGNNDNTGMSYSGVLSGTGSSLIKTGTGTQTLSGANTYTGKTTISGGTLELGAGGSIANSSEIALNGGTFNVSAVAGYSTAASQALTGSGSITGDITVTGTLAIGNSPGTMTFNDDLTIGSSAISNFELTDIAFGSGTYDLAQGGVGTQTATFGGTLNLLFSGGTYTDNTSVQIFDFEIYSGGFTTVNFSGLGVGQSATFNASTGFVTVIPEPGAALLGGIGMLVLLRRRRN